MGHRPLFGRLVPKSEGGKFLAWMLSAFLVVATVNGIMVWYALSTFSGLTDRNYYEDGVSYNQTLARMAAQKALDWTVSATYEKGHLLASFKDRTGQPLDRLTVTAVFRRPTREGFDRRVTLDWAGNGRYKADIALPLQGVWDLEVNGEGAAGHYQYLQRLFAQ